MTNQEFNQAAAIAKSNAATLREIIVQRKRESLQGISKEEMKLIAELDGDSMRRELARESLEKQN